MEQDTSPEQVRRCHELLRKMTPAMRLEKACALPKAVRSLAEAGIRKRHPQASDEEVRVRLAVRLYGREGARQMRMVIPDDAV